MASQDYTIYSGDFTDANNNTVGIQVVTIGDRAYIIVDDVDFGLQGNVPDVETGITGASRQIVALTDSNNDDYDLDVTDPQNPTLTQK